MKIVHISTHFFPVNGGQQIYIQNMMHYLDNFEHIVIQIGNKNTVYPQNVYPIYIPNILSYKALSFYAFNHFLDKKINELIKLKVINPKDDIFLSHYGFHYSVVKKYPNVIVLSHGVEWDGPGNIFRKLYHIHRKLINKTILYDDGITLVANDRNFFESLGFKHIKESNYFTEISKNKWLLPNCVDNNKFKKINLNKKLLKDNSIIVPRNIVPQRGMDIVIESFASLVKIKKYEDYVLYIIGAKYDLGYYEELVKLVKRMGLENKVIFFGSVPHGMMPLIYNSAKLTIIFSLFREGTSLAALESMACGTPVITSDIGGLKELPTVKSTKDKLPEVIMNTLSNYNYISKMQMDFTRKNYNMENWTKTWSAILGKYV